MKDVRNYARNALNQRIPKDTSSFHISIRLTSTQSSPELSLLLTRSVQASNRALTGLHSAVSAHASSMAGLGSSGSSGSGAAAAGVSAGASAVDATKTFFFIAADEKIFVLQKNICNFQKYF